METKTVSLFKFHQQFQCFLGDELIDFRKINTVK